ncbi:MAG TPA: flagellar hook-associated protein FlgK [Terriglobales bacterium]|nr:flagellar hook-associated protein FlgK [Terriglobales bacterium]
MSSLFGTMSVSLRALLAQQAALQTTAENIGNVNTAGYARRRAVMIEDDPVLDGRLTIGNGVHLARIESLRDGTLEIRIHEETQQQGELDGYIGAMRQVESLFSDVDHGIGAQLDKFFQSLTRLSTGADNIPLRQNVVTAAGNLASTFNNVANRLKALQQTLDGGLVQAASDINTITAQIADLNVEVSRQRTLGDDAGTFEDQRTQLIRELSELVNVSVINADDGVTLTTADGAALVVGAHAFQIETSLQSSGLRHVYSQGRDITSGISGGRMGGLLRARDAGAESLLSDLDRMASGVITEINAAHRQGFDLNGVAGQDLFAPASPTDSAAKMRLVISDPAAIAASSDGSVGDSGNVSRLSDVATAAVISGQTPLDYYSGMVGRFGNDLGQAEAEREAVDLIMRQLSNQRAAVSGVSLDEEAANLIRYQRAFEAAARVVSVIDDLTQTVINLGRN